MKIREWEIDEDKFMDLPKVSRLRTAALNAKNTALRRHNRVAVYDWFTVELGLYSGLRVAEMAMLWCSDLRLKAPSQGIQVRRGKGGYPRFVRISPAFAETCREFLQWKKARGESTAAKAPVFYSVRTGRSLTTRALQKSFKRSLHRAELRNYGIHCLRHTYGTHLYAASMYNLRLVQRQLGHLNAKSTERYASVLRGDTDDALRRLYQPWTIGTCLCPGNLPDPYEHGGVSGLNWKLP